MGVDDIIMCECGHSKSAHDDEGRCEFCCCQEFEED